MSQKGAIVNVFEKGMVRDTIPERQPEGTYTYGLNLINGSNEHVGVLTNEESNVKFNSEDYDGEIVGVSHFAKIDQSAVFTAASTIYLTDHTTGKVTKVINETDFGCNWNFGGCEMMYGVLKLLQPCNDRVVYFSTDDTYYKVNVDEVLSDRKNCIEDCTHFELFRCVCTPKASLFPVEGGGFMRSGAYWISLQLEDNDGNQTNWFPVEGPVFIGSENNIAGEISNQSIRIYVDAIDEGYDKVNIAVIKKVRGVVSAEIVVSRPHSNTSFTYDYIGDNPNAEQVSLEEILTRGRKFIRGKDLFQKDGVLYLYGIRQEINVNYQRHANGVQTRVVEFEVTAETQSQYNLPSLMRDEVVGVVMWLNYCDGTQSRGFHVPAGNGGGSVSATDSYASTAGGQVVNANSNPIPGTTGQSIPYTSDFTDWNSDWVYQTTPTGNKETGPEGSNFYRAPAKGNTELTAKSPSVDLISSLDPIASFEYYMYGEEVGDFKLQASTDGFRWVTIWERSGNQGRGWLEGSADLRPFEGSYVQFRIVSTPKGANGDVAVRNFSVTNSSGLRDDGASNLYDTGFYDTSQSVVTTRGVPPDEDPGSDLDEAIAADIDNLGCSEDRAEESINEFADYLDVDDMCTDDYDDLSNMAQNVSENLAEFAQDDTDPELNQTSSIKEAAKNLYDKAVKDREKVTRGKADWKFRKSSRYQPTTDTELSATRIDNWTTTDGTNILPEKPRIISVYEPKVYESEIPYPDQCDCDGERMYPEGNIKHHRMPANHESPHYISNQIGVPSKKDPVNSAYADTYVRLLGLEFSNIYIPKDEELPKPLCKENPVTFGILKRDLNNRSVIAKGLLTATFTGNVRGREHAMGKHGVNSFETVDIAIDNDGSKIGVDDSPNAYLFHSLDTTCQRIPLTVTDLVPELELYGSGWRYGLYAEGEKPDLWFTGKQIDQRGARQAVALTAQASNNAEEKEVTGITYAPADSVVTPPRGINLPLNNRYRESSVYLQLDSKMPALTQGVKAESDASFVGDVLDHSAPITRASAWYVSLKRELKSQYGSVENQKGISTGILAPEASPGTYTSTMGICGDVFIGVHSMKRSGYVSDKVGDLFPVANGSSDGRQSDWKRDRSICDHPNDFDMQNLGIDHWATRLPESGDVNDAKNWAGLHTTDVTYAAQDASQRTAPDSDYYYPRVQKTLVTYWGEFEVNPWKRATGEGTQKVEGKVYYPALKDLVLDSSFSDDIPWPEGWLNRFYVEVEQPSKAALARKAMIRTLLSLIIPVFGLLIVTQVESIPDSILTVVVLPLISAYLIYAKQRAFTDEFLNKIVGIPICKTDEEGGEDYVRVRGMEDNYTGYHFDFSSVNEFNYALGIPSNYNTCVCTDVSTKEIYYSNKQVETSVVDSYRNFQANNYNVIPAHAGPLQKLFVESNRFYAHTTDGLWVLQYNNVTQQLDGITAILGKGDLLRDPQQLNEGPTEGYLGLTDPNASISCEAGYVFVSRPSGGIIRMSNGQLDLISSKGMYNFFQENLRFCGEGDCIDEREDLDFVLGYDPRYKRILVTKRDETETRSWTASYHIPTESWTSFHSYVPRFYIWDQKSMFTTHKRSIYIHGVQNIFNGDSKTWCNFYGIKYPVTLEFPARHQSGEPWQYQHTMFDLDVQKPYKNDWLRGRHEFFDEMAAWNRTQSTGVLPVEKPERTDNPDNENDVISRLNERKDRVEVNYAGDQWRVNNLTDHIKSCNGAVTSKKDICSPELIILDQGGKSPGQNNIMDRYLFYRLVFKAPTKFKIYIKSVITAMTMSSE